MRSIANIALMVVLGTALAGLWTFYLYTIVWAAMDARSRGSSWILAALFVALLFWPVGLLVWLLFRPNRLIVETRVAKFGWGFSLTMLLVFVTAFAALFAIFARSQNVISVGVMRVVPADPLLAINSPVTLDEFRKGRDAAIAYVQSDALIEDAIRESGVSVDTEMVKSRLSVDCPDDGELIVVELRGKRFSEGQAALDAIVRAIVDRCAATWRRGNTRVDVIN